MLNHGPPIKTRQIGHNAGNGGVRTAGLPRAMTRPAGRLKRLSPPSSVIAQKGAFFSTPALLTRMSMLPKWPNAAETRRSISVRLLKSALNATTRRPYASISADVSLASSGWECGTGLVQADHGMTTISCSVGKIPGTRWAGARLPAQRATVTRCAASGCFAGARERLGKGQR